MWIAQKMPNPVEWGCKSESWGRKTSKLVGFPGTPRITNQFKCITYLELDTTELLGAVGNLKEDVFRHVTKVMFRNQNFSLTSVFRSNLGVHTRKTPAISIKRCPLSDLSFTLETLHITSG